MGDGGGLGVCPHGGDQDLPVGTGALEDRFSGTALLSKVARTATYTRAYADSNGFLTLLSDGQRLTGAYGLGPEAGEWMGQITLAIRAQVPLEIVRDTIQPFPSFSEIVAAAVKTLRHTITAASAADRTATPTRDTR